MSNVDVPILEVRLQCAFTESLQFYYDILNLISLE